MVMYPVTPLESQAITLKVASFAALLHIAHFLLASFSPVQDESYSKEYQLLGLADLGSKDR
jgi:hypothetical protein